MWKVIAMDKLELRHVWKFYGDVEAVKDLNFSCKEGEFLAILGPSGCGKSSTLRMIAGIEEISRGEILLDGKVINDIEARNRNIAMAFETYALYPHLTLYENIAFPLRIRKFPRNKINEKVLEVAQMLNIDDVLDKRPSQVSGGHQQRTSLARALVREASIYLMDEPLSHLDTEQRTQLRAEIKRIQKLNNLTVIFVTHDQLEALAMADRVVIMNFGVLQQIGTPEEVYDYPENLFVADFVGEPAINLVPYNIVYRDGRFYGAIHDRSFPIPDRYTSAMKEKVSAGKKEFILGIRPMYLTVAEDGDLAGEVYVFENLGDIGSLTVKIGESLIRIELPPGIRFEIGENVRFKFDPDKMLIFDKETGLRIKNQGERGD